MAEKLKHTPGPWQYGEDEGIFEIRMATAIDSGTYDCQHCVEWSSDLYPEDWDQYEEAEANIRLMAAAPDLLEACKELTDILANSTADNMMRLKQAHNQALAAIAKASGLTPKGEEEK